MVLRRKLESTRPIKTVSIISTMPISDPDIPPDPSHAESVDIEAQMPCSSRSVLASPGQPVFHIGSHDEQDPFKIRTLLDNMKQMVMADIPQEKPYE